MCETAFIHHIIIKHFIHLIHHEWILKRRNSHARSLRLGSWKIVLIRLHRILRHHLHHRINLIHTRHMRMHRSHCTDSLHHWCLHRILYWHSRLHVHWWHHLPEQGIHLAHIHAHSHLLHWLLGNWLLLSHHLFHLPHISIGHACMRWGCLLHHLGHLSLLHHLLLLLFFLLLLHCLYLLLL